MPTEPDARETREFAGKRVLVTGGATVVTTARSVAAGGGAPDRFIQADVSTREGCEQVIKTTLDRLGGLDILINSVGGSTAPGGGALALTDDHWQQTLDLNLLSA